MTTVATKTVYTPEDLLAMPDGKNYELVDGNLVERNVSVLSSWIGGRLFRRVAAYCEDNNLGIAWPADNSLQCYPQQPSKVRRADVCYVRRDRLTPQILEQGHLRVRPDLVAEVISPNDTAEELDEKISEYQAIGIPLIWIVHPSARTVRVYRATGTTSLLRESDELDGEEVVAGFRWPVRDLLPTFPVAAEPTSQQNTPR